MAAEGRVKRLIFAKPTAAAKAIQSQHSWSGHFSDARLRVSRSTYRSRRGFPISASSEGERTTKSAKEAGSGSDTTVPEKTVRGGVPSWNKK